MRYGSMEIDYLRKEIDEIDKKILKLFEDRMELCKKVALYKKENNLPVFQPERERKLLNEKLNLVKDPALGDAVYDLFSLIMEKSRALQSKIIGDEVRKRRLREFIKINEKEIENPKIIYFGEEGSFSEEAAISHFGENAIRKNAKTFEDVFLAVEKGICDFGVLPIENTSTGSINDVYDLLAQYGCYIYGEIKIAINQCLLGVEGASVDTISEVFSHEQGFFQCKEFFKEHPDIKKTPYSSTSESAKYVKELGDITKGAIAGKRAAEKYGLKVLKENINYSKNNKTRFIIISKFLSIKDDANEISITFTLPHESGTLFNVLSTLAKNNLSMSRIESRPIQDKSFEYRFFVDFLGNLKEEYIKSALFDIMEKCLEFRLLGNYKSEK